MKILINLRLSENYWLPVKKPSRNHPHFHGPFKQIISNIWRNSIQESLCCVMIMWLLNQELIWCFIVIYKSLYMQLGHLDIEISASESPMCEFQHKDFFPEKMLNFFPSWILWSQKLDLLVNDRNLHTLFKHATTRCWCRRICLNLNLLLAFTDYVDEFVGCLHFYYLLLLNYYYYYY